MSVDECIDNIFTAVNCGDPPDIGHSDASYTNTTFMSKANYTCQKGYKVKLLGLENDFSTKWHVGICDVDPDNEENGKWSNLTVICVGMYIL